MKKHLFALKERMKGRQDIIRDFICHLSINNLMWHAFFPTVHFNNKKYSHPHTNRYKITRNTICLFSIFMRCDSLSTFKCILPMWKETVIYSISWSTHKKKSHIVHFTLRRERTSILFLCLADLFIRLFTRRKIKTNGRAHLEYTIHFATFTSKLYILAK